MRIALTIRMVAGLAFLTVSMMLIARSLNLGPGLAQTHLEDRARLCEAVAVSSSLFLTQGDTRSLHSYLDAVVEHNPDITAAILRKKEGTLFAQIGNVDEISDNTEAGVLNQIKIELVEQDQPWGQLEFYCPAENITLSSFWRMPMFQFMAFVFVGCFVGFYLCLRKSFQYLNPSQVIPNRVQDALDTLAGGLLILDSQEQIVLANKTIAKALNITPEQIQGQAVSQLPWMIHSDQETRHEMPWTRVLKEGASLKGVMVSIQSPSDATDSFVVSCAPIHDDQSKLRGVLVSFEDVTELEKKKTELHEMLTALHESREVIQKKNEELQILATRDPLTSCLNRRSFYEQMETLWAEAIQMETSLGCVLLDIDHFKSINDNHGHSTGDLVLKGIGSALMELVGDTGVLCRYGGEEFCILLPNQDIDETEQTAEVYRQTVERLEFSDLKVTSSFGATAISLGASNPQNLLDEADKCLYAAKRGGRNQVARWDRIPADMDFTETIAREPANELPAENVMSNESASDQEWEIPFYAVTALLSALAFRDENTAAHSRRVADLCLAAAQDLLPPSELYVLEIAALLHDIGKIGVPDAILLKPGPLTGEEWEVMSRHDRIGVEIVSSTFSDQSLLEIIENHHAFYRGEGRHENLPTGQDIPLGARILSIADAYDAMVSDRVYRKRMSQEEAFAELRKNAGTQFDPDLVEKFISEVAEKSEELATDHFLVSEEDASPLIADMERLVQAIDQNDFAELEILAAQLQETAIQCDLLEIADTACQLQNAAQVADIVEAIDLTNRLLELCQFDVTLKTEIQSV
ncbi:diguanylate cyclase [Gimesia sp.]|uniref:diguanylate cyclase domain-containing protein n=1 Tax=Gimesia sp. TaxID=2024833 RepID=UPI000C3FC07D|nr:diguanylate cyclase [Gimesia sp.]MAX40611.1 diguanylate cyclase [Gimesia sp.]HAH43279.1 diguanylate cyclase [Planctomycetaceae bacterium]|tara:strand:+ start:1454 stop:3880 length:2427 start_codon:yes stop_codon:yes gene_type:complete